MYQPGQRAKAFFQQTSGLKPDATAANKLQNKQNVYQGETGAYTDAANDVKKQTNKVSTVNTTFDSQPAEKKLGETNSRIANTNLNIPVVVDNGNYNTDSVPGYKRTDMDLINEKKGQLDQVNKIDLSAGALDPLRTASTEVQKEKSNFVEGANTYGESRNKDINADLAQTNIKNMGDVGAENVVEQDTNAFYKMLIDKDPSNIGLLSNLYGGGYDATKYGAVDSNVLQGIFGAQRAAAQGLTADRQGSISGAESAKQGYANAADAKRAEIAQNYKGYQANVEKLKAGYDAALAEIKRKLDEGVINLASAREQKTKIEGELKSQQAAMDKKVADAKIEDDRLAREYEAGVAAKQEKERQARVDERYNILTGNTHKIWNKAKEEFNK